MTTDEIQSMAIEAGFVQSPTAFACAWWVPTDMFLNRFAAMVAAKERDACAQVAESTPWVDGGRIPSNREIARAIREMGKS